MYFITIDELDYVCAMIRKVGASISEMIETATKADKSPETRKFEFIQHLLEMSQSLEASHYLVKEKEQIFEKIRRILS